MSVMVSNCNIHFIYYVCISWQQRSLYVSLCCLVLIIGLGQCPSWSRYSVMFIENIRVVWKLKILIDYPCLDVFHRVLGKLFSSLCLNTFMTNLSQYLWLRRNLLNFWIERSLDLYCGHLLIVASGQERNL